MICVLKKYTFVCVLVSCTQQQQKGAETGIAVISSILFCFDSAAIMHLTLHHLLCSCMVLTEKSNVLTCWAYVKSASTAGARLNSMRFVAIMCGRRMQNWQHSALLPS